jgi:hypothetical protein
MAGLDIDTTIIDIPFRQQKAQGEENEPFPQFAWLSPFLVALHFLRTDVDGGTRFNVAFVRVQ